MLNYKILENKKTITKDKVEYIDLLGETYSEVDIKGGYPIIVNKYYVARPDLISLAIYGDDKYADIICKLNGISNPFELNEDDIIYIPPISFINTCAHGITNENDLIKEDDTNDFIEIQKSYNFQKKKNESRSPNQQVVGDSNYVIDKSAGIVFY